MSHSRTSLQLTVLRLTGTALGFLFTFGLALVFGANRQTDALTVAMAIPILFFRNICRGIYNALVPCLVEENESQEQTGFLETYNQILFAVSAMLLCLALAGAPLIIRLTAPGLPPETAASAVRLFRILAPCIVGFLYFGSFQGALYAENHFLAPEWGQLTWKLTAIICLFTVGRRYGIEALAISLTGATFLQMAVTAAAGRIQIDAYRPRPRSHMNWRAMRPFAKALVVIGTAIVMGECEMIVDQFALSFLPEGSVTQHSYARRLALQLPFLLSFCLLMPLIPDVTRLKTRSSRGRMNIIHLLAFHMGGAGVLLGMFFFWAAPDIIGLLFHHGSFDANSASIVTNTMRTMSFAVPALMLMRPFKGHYFVERNLRITVLVGILGILVHGAGNWALCRFGVPGIGLAGVLGAWAVCACLWIISPPDTPVTRPWRPLLAVCIFSAAWLLALSFFWKTSYRVIRLPVGAAGIALVYVRCMLSPIRRMDKQLRDLLDGKDHAHTGNTDPLSQASFKSTNSGALK